MKFAICNLGCKVNNYEANWYQQQLSLKYQEVDFHQFADIYIINSCTVTNMAGSKTRQMLHRARKQNPDAVIVCVSCYSQMESEKITEDCDIIIGSKDKKRLPELIEEYLINHRKINIVEKFNVTEFENMPIDNFNQTRAYLKIQDGCNQFCCYCVIPYARGRERCLDGDRVIEQAKKLVKAGHIEIVLTGIHTGRWHDGNSDLTALIKRMLKEVDGLKRIRLSSIEMTEITDELIELMASDNRVARHLHIPLQVGNDRLLKLNNRPYTTEDYFNRISYIRSKIFDVSISSDVIAGLPTETDEEFQQTADFIKKCELSFLHAFPYAKKQHTVDAELKPQTEEIKKKERTAVLTSLSKILLLDFCDRFVGKTADVVFETEEDGIIAGHSSEYIVVKAKGDVSQCHTMQKVLIKEKKGTELYGEIV